MCLYGFFDYVHSYDVFLLVFVDGGYYVVLLWLRGYVLSGFVFDGCYELVCIVVDVVEFVVVLGLDWVKIVGYDWGVVVMYVVCIFVLECFSRVVVMVVLYVLVFVLIFFMNFE